MKARALQLGGATAWLNSSRLTSAELRRKVVLVDFWTYFSIQFLDEGVTMYAFLRL